MANEALRVGLIGYGLAGEVFHAPLIAATSGLRLTTVVTGSADRAARARERYPGIEVVGAADDLWTRSDELDLVVVASPNRTHVPLAEAAVERGLPVVIDKPLAGTADEGRELVRKARDRGVALTVFQNRRWDADFLTLRPVIEEGTLGEVVRFESRFDRWRVEAKPGWRQSGDARDAGGLLYDLGAHLIDQALVLFGPAVDVYAELDRRRPGAEVDDDSFVAITHSGGVRSHLWMSTLAAQPGARFRVMGTAASFVKFGLDPQEAALRDGGVPGSAGWGSEPEESWAIVGVGDSASSIPSRPGAYQSFYADLERSLRTGAPPPVDPSDAVAVLETIEAAQRSHAERRVVRL